MLSAPREKACKYTINFQRIKKFCTFLTLFLSCDGQDKGFPAGCGNPARGQDASGGRVRGAARNPGVRPAASRY